MVKQITNGVKDVHSPNLNAYENKVTSAVCTQFRTMCPLHNAYKIQTSWSGCVSPPNTSYFTDYSTHLGKFQYRWYMQTMWL